MRTSTSLGFGALLLLFGSVLSTQLYAALAGTAESLGAPFMLAGFALHAPWKLFPWLLDGPLEGSARLLSLVPLALSVGSLMALVLVLGFRRQPGDVATPADNQQPVAVQTPPAADPARSPYVSPEHSLLFPQGERSTPTSEGVVAPTGDVFDPETPRYDAADGVFIESTLLEEAADVAPPPVPPSVAATLQDPDALAALLASDSRPRLDTPVKNPFNLRTRKLTPEEIPAEVDLSATLRAREDLPGMFDTVKVVGASDASNSADALEEHTQPQPTDLGREG